MLDSYNDRWKRLVLADDALAAHLKQELQAEADALPWLHVRPRTVPPRADAR